MEIQHLNNNEVMQSADSIATGSASESVSDKSKKHLKGCERCQNTVNNEAELLKIKYSNEIAYCLNNSRTSTNNKYLWIGLMVSIIIAGIIGFAYFTENLLLVLR